MSTVDSQSQASARGSGVLFAEFRQSENTHMGGVLFMLDLETGDAARVNGGILSFAGLDGEKWYASSTAPNPSSLESREGLEQTTPGGWLVQADAFNETACGLLSRAFPEAVSRSTLEGGGYAIDVQVRPDLAVRFEFDSSGRPVSFLGEPVTATPVPGIEGVYAIPPKGFAFDRAWFDAGATLDDAAYLDAAVRDFEAGVLARSTALEVAQPAAAPPPPDSGGSSVLTQAVIIGGVLLVIIGIVAWIRRAQ